MIGGNTTENDGRGDEPVGLEKDSKVKIKRP